MKTYLAYGAGLALTVFVVQLLFFVLGLHSDVDKFNGSQWVQSIANLAVTIVFIALGTRACGAAAAPEAGFPYGRALGAGFGITVVSSVIGAGLNLLYQTVVNPRIIDIMVQAQLNKLEAKGLSGDQLEQPEKFMRLFMGPVLGPIVYVFVGLFFGTLIALLVAAFVKRPAPSQVASA